MKQQQAVLQRLDSLQLRFFKAQDATNLLENNSNTYVRNYGLSNLSTLSIRGSSVAQTNVLWNNIPIQNTMLGLTDLSTLPTFFFEKMQVQPSSFDEADKMQSVGGSLQLQSKLSFTDSTQWNNQLLYGYETVDNHAFGAKTLISTPRIAARFKYYNRQGVNKYKFYNSYLDRQDTIRHAFAVQEQFMADVSFKLSATQNLDAHYWSVRNKRQIAPLAFGYNESRSEQNIVHRWALAHSLLGASWRLQTSAGLTMDSFHYRDNAIRLTSKARVINLPLQSSLKYYLSSTSSVTASYQQQLSYYVQHHLQESLHQYGAKLFYQRSAILGRIDLNAFVQKQFTTLGQNPWNYGLRISTAYAKKQFAYLSYNTNFRIPTLNELYYFPGGNIDLLPEKSQNVELGFVFKLQKGKLNITNTTVLYSRLVDDWIIWTGAAIFFPDNIAQVWSRGIETTNSLKMRIGAIDFRNDFLLHINRSSSQRAYFANDKSVGKQIPYVPQLSWRNNLYADYHKFSAQIHIGYTGYRFVTRDETEFVNPYILTNFYMGYKWQIGKQKLHTQLRLNNLFNQTYQSVRGRIMPGRNAAMTILFEL